MGGFSKVSRMNDTYADVGILLDQYFLHGTVSIADDIDTALQLSATTAVDGEDGRGCCDGRSIDRGDCSGRCSTQIFELEVAEGTPLLINKLFSLLQTDAHGICQTILNTIAKVNGIQISRSRFAGLRIYIGDHVIEHRSTVR